MPMTVSPRGGGSRAAAVSVRTSRAGSRGTSRVARAGEEGVWMAALSLGFVSCAMPAWVVGAALVLAGGEATALSHAMRLALIAVGAVAVLAAARTAVVLSRAPRLGKRHDRRTLRYAAAGVAVLTFVFVWQCVSVGTSFEGDVVMGVAAAASAILMAVLSLALPVIGGGRHGTAIGGIGGYLWFAVALALLLILAAPGIWWIALLLSIAAAGCTAPAAVRIWRHYEAAAIGA